MIGIYDMNIMSICYCKLKEVSGLSMNAIYGLVDHSLWWNDKMITSLQIMNKYQRNPIYCSNFIDSIKPQLHTINQNDVYVGLKTIIIIYALGKFIKIDNV